LIAGHAILIRLRLVANGAACRMSAADFDAVMGNRPLLEAIVEMRQKAHKSWEIQSTPSFVVNDKTIISGDLSYEDFAAKINATDA
jgi:protein-disulfide isomerase